MHRHAGRLCSRCRRTTMCSVDVRLDFATDAHPDCRLRHGSRANGASHRNHRADQDRLTRPRAPLLQGRRQAKPTAPTAAPARPCTGVARRRRLPAPTPVGAFFLSVRMHRSAMQVSRGDERQAAITTISRPLDEPEYVVRITVVAGHSSPPRAFRLGVFSACVPSRTANACRRSVMARRLSVAVPPRADTPPVRHESPASSAGDSS